MLEVEEAIWKIVQRVRAIHWTIGRISGHDILSLLMRSYSLLVNFTFLRGVVRSGNWEVCLFDLYDM